MVIISKIKKIILTPKEYAIALLNRCAFLFPDKLFLKLKFRLRVGYKLDLKHPVTYNQKIQWLKLYGRCSEDTRLADKLEVKEIGADKIGREHVVPLLGSWDNVEDIDFASLPNRFVLKVTHDSGGVFVCKDKSNLDYDEVRRLFKTSLERDFYLVSREKAYRNIPHRIIAEEYIEDDNGTLKDYKFFCFNGEPKILFIADGRQKGEEYVTFDFYDMNFNHLPIINGHPNASVEQECPKTFEKMKQLAAILSKGIPHVRVDLYEVGDKVYFGEYTFSHWGGMTPFSPIEWDYRMGEWINLDLVKK